MNWYKRHIYAGRPKRLPSVTLRDLMKILNKEECQFVRKTPRGHNIWRCPNNNNHNFPIPNHRGDITDVITPIIQKGLGMTVDEFVNKYYR